MKWLNIQTIKQHSRICSNGEDTLLTTYANAAEQFILDYISRTYENVVDLYGEVPPQFFEAGQLLVDTMYTYRMPLTVGQLSKVDYTFDPMVQFFVRHTSETPLQCERDTLLDKLADVKANLDFAYGNIDTPTDEQQTAYQQLLDIISRTQAKYASIENPTSAICAMLRTQVATTKEEAEEDFPVNPDTENE